MNYWIWYTTLDSLNPTQKKKLLEVYDTPEKIFYAKREELSNLNFLKKSNIEEIVNNKNIELIKKYENYMISHNIKMINILDKEYPIRLRKIYDPPITLFAKGNISLLNKASIAIIGCRDASNYGLNMAQKLSYEIASKNIVIVSGMAKGIDGMAHKGALIARRDAELCNTVAVLGSGVDYPYPKENVELYKSIIKNGGLVISEYIVGTKPVASNFPRRNRIISGISDGVLVVEAKVKSGTMITVDFALEQGKEIYVVPGNIDSIYSEGTNDLIKQGAKLITSVEDIIEDCSYLHFGYNII